MKIVRWTILTLTGWLSINACQDVKSYPAVPEIEFKSYQILNAQDDLGNNIKTIEILFGFTDGDGDLFSPDTSFKSLILKFYKKTDGAFIQIPDSTLIPAPKLYLGYSSVMDRSNGQNKTQKGTIKFDYSFYYPMPYDTIELEFYIKDLAGNKSDSIKTPEIPLK